MMPAPATPRKKQAARKSDGEWEEHKEVIYQLYMVERKTLEETRQIMTAQGFIASRRQYVYRLTRWNMGKYNSGNPTGGDRNSEGSSPGRAEPDQAGPEYAPTYLAGPAPQQQPRPTIPEQPVNAPLQHLGVPEQGHFPAPQYFFQPTHYGPPSPQHPTPFFQTEYEKSAATFRIAHCHADDNRASVTGFRILDGLLYGSGPAGTDPSPDPTWRWEYWLEQLARSAQDRHAPKVRRYFSRVTRDAQANTFVLDILRAQTFDTGSGDPLPPEAASRIEAAMNPILSSNMLAEVARLPRDQGSFDLVAYSCLFYALTKLQVPNGQDVLDAYSSSRFLRLGQPDIRSHIRGCLQWILDQLNSQQPPPIPSQFDVVNVAGLGGCHAWWDNVRIFSALSHRLFLVSYPPPSSPNPASPPEWSQRCQSAWGIDPCEFLRTVCWLLMTDVGPVDSEPGDSPVESEVLDAKDVFECARVGIEEYLDLPMQKLGDEFLSQFLDLNEVCRLSADEKRFQGKLCEAVRKYVHEVFGTENEPVGQDIPMVMPGENPGNSSLG